MRLAIISLAIGLALAGAVAIAAPNTAVDYAVPDIDALPDDAQGRLVRQGRTIFTATFVEIGPEVADASKRYAGNNLACTNCHLNAGVKPFGLPLWGVFEDYPRYNAEAGKDISIERRIDGCMERSMNGRAMPADTPEMKALVAYLRFLSTAVPPGKQLSERGAGRMAELDRAADPERGRSIYAARCYMCHMPDGSGIRHGLATMTEGYAVPPLWGQQSFNDGAGMNRLITAANFVHSNMPAGASHEFPQMSVEDSWDVAAYVLAQPRPRKADLDRDFPDLAEKPVDTAYGPYLDDFPERQHKFGPFTPIREALKQLKAGTAPGRPVAPR